MVVENYLEGDLRVEAPKGYKEDILIDVFSEIEICTGLEALFQAIAGELKSNIGSMNTTLLFYGSDIPKMIGKVMDKNLEEELFQKIKNVVDKYSAVVLDHIVQIRRWDEEMAEIMLTIITINGRLTGPISIRKMSGGIEHG